MTKVKTDAEINSMVNQSVVSHLNINEARINSYPKFVQLRNQPLVREQINSTVSQLVLGHLNRTQTENKYLV